MSIRDWPIERKFLAGTLVLIFATISLVSIPLLVTELRLVRAARLANSRAFAGMIATNAAAALIYGDEQVAQQILSGAGAEPYAEAAALYDAHNNLFAWFPTNLPASSLPKTGQRAGVDFSSHKLEIFADVMNGDKYAGAAYLRMDLSGMRRRFRIYVSAVICVAVVSTFLVLLLSKQLQRWITKPLLTLSSTAQTIAEQGDYSLRVPKHGADEVGRLVDSFNRMLSEVQGAHDRQRTYAADLEREVQLRTAQLRTSIHDLEAFSYSVSHDMRAPLRAMQGYAQFLLDESKGKLNQDELDYLGRIRRAATRLDGLVQDILAYSRISRSDLQRTEVDLDRIVRDVVAEYPNLRDTHITVAYPLGRARGHAAALTQVLSNLLANGAKFARPGTAPAIHVRSQAEGRRLRIFVQDNGIGIAEKDLQRIFGIFERVHPTTEYEGTGIGLSIVKRAVEKMGGTLGVSSELGIGSTFWFELERIADEKPNSIG